MYCSLLLLLLLLFIIIQALKSRDGFCNVLWARPRVRVVLCCQL